VSNRIQALFSLVEDDLRELRPDLSKSQIQLNARALWSGVHGAAALSLNDQLYLPADKQDQVVIEQLISAFLQSFCLPEVT